MSTRRRAKVAPRPSRTVGCGQDHGRTIGFGVKLTLAEAIRDLSMLHDAKGERWKLITGLLHVCVHREMEQRMDDADQRRRLFTLVKGAVNARGEEA